MNKYAEAIEDKKKEFEYYKELARKQTFEDTIIECVEMAHRAMIDLEALQIANRLEQADVTKHKKVYYNHDDSEHGDGYCIGFQDGYELALEDIRGEGRGDKK